MSEYSICNCIHRYIRKAPRRKIVAKGIAICRPDVIS